MRRHVSAVFNRSYVRLNIRNIRLELRRCEACGIVTGWEQMVVVVVAVVVSKAA